MQDHPDGGEQPAVVLPHQLPAVWTECHAGDAAQEHRGQDHLTHAHQAHEHRHQSAAYTF